MKLSYGLARRLTLHRGSQGKAHRAPSGAAVTLVEKAGNLFSLRNRSGCAKSDLVLFDAIFLHGDTTLNSREDGLKIERPSRLARNSLRINVMGNARLRVNAADRISEESAHQDLLLPDFSEKLMLSGEDFRVLLNHLLLEHSYFLLFNARGGLDETLMQLDERSIVIGALERSALDRNLRLL